MTSDSDSDGGDDESLSNGGGSFSNSGSPGPSKNSSQNFNSSSSSGLSLTFTEGELVWALVKGYPYWPALVFADPASGETSRTVGWETTTIHVIFLCSKKQTAWVKDTNIVTFSRANQFAHILEDCSPQVAAQFRPSKLTAKRYEEAEKSALLLLATPVQDRVDMVFNENL